MEESQEVAMKIDVRRHVDVQYENIVCIDVFSANVPEEVVGVRHGERVVVMVLDFRMGETVDQKISVSLREIASGQLDNITSCAAT